MLKYREVLDINLNYMIRDKDIKNIEIEDLRNYIKTIKLEISTNEKKNEIINDVQ